MSQNSSLRLFTCFLCLLIQRRQSQLSATPDPTKVLPESRPSLSSAGINWGVTAACVYARLLNRSGCGLVTVFEQSTGSAVWLFPKAFGTTPNRTFIRYPIHNPFRQECSSLSLRSSASGISHTWIHSLLRSSKTFAQSPPLIRPPSLPRCAKPWCILHRSPTSPSRFLSGLPPSLNSRRLAHFSEIGIYTGNSVYRTDPDCNVVKHRGRSASIPLSLPCSRTSFRHFATLMASFRFPCALAVGTFSFLSSKLMIS